MFSVKPSCSLGCRTCEFHKGWWVLKSRTVMHLSGRGVLTSTGLIVYWLLIFDCEARLGFVRCIYSVGGTV